jgi:hypothetical protein
MRPESSTSPALLTFQEVRDLIFVDDPDSYYFEIKTKSELDKVLHSFVFIDTVIDSGWSVGGFPRRKKLFIQNKINISIIICSQKTYKYTIK